MTRTMYKGKKWSDLDDAWVRKGLHRGWHTRTTSSEVGASPGAPSTPPAMRSAISVAACRSGAVGTEVKKQTQDKSNTKVRSLTREM